MTALGPYTQALNRTYMFDFVDLKGDKTPDQLLCYPENSLMGFIASHPQLTLFKKLVIKARYNAILAAQQANLTIFAPLDEGILKAGINVDAFDIGAARQAVSAAIIRRRIGMDILTSSPVCYYDTRNPEMRMYTTNICNNTRLNERANVVKFNAELDNGILHFVDNLLVPCYVNFMR